MIPTPCPLPRAALVAACVAAWPLAHADVVLLAPGTTADGASGFHRSSDNSPLSPVGHASLPPDEGVTGAKVFGSASTPASLTDPTGIHLLATGFTSGRFTRDAVMQLDYTFSASAGGLFGWGITATLHTGSGTWENTHIGESGGPVSGTLTLHDILGSEWIPAGTDAEEGWWTVRLDVTPCAGELGAPCVDPETLEFLGYPGVSITVPEHSIDFRAAPPAVGAVPVPAPWMLLGAAWLGWRHRRGAACARPALA